MKLVALLAVAAAVAAAPASGLGGPRVWPLRTTPLVVSGSGFAAHTSVRVRVSAAGLQASAITRTTAAGRLVVRFGVAVELDGCHPGAITAVAANGARAAWKPVPSASCANQQPVDR